MTRSGALTVSSEPASNPIFPVDPHREFPVPPVPEASDAPTQIATPREGMLPGGEGTWSNQNLQDFHGTLGKPLQAPLPERAPEELAWKATYKIERLLGSGAQGVVYLATRHGVDGYFTRVAAKIFYRNSIHSQQEYLAEMQRIALQAQRISDIQHDNLITVRDFVAIDNTRVMVLEWVDGIDLAQLVDPRLLTFLKERLPRRSWAHLNDVILTEGEDHSRVRPGVAVDIIHGCLGGLSALHNRGIAHCDLKPSNLMIKRTGTIKIIDLDSSCDLIEGRNLLRGTPYYMAPEQLRREPIELHSDIASLGYMLIEMLVGKRLFRECASIPELMSAKVNLPDRLEELLPEDVKANGLLYGMVRKMIAVDPAHRFHDANDADLGRQGAVSFHRDLVRQNLATEYHRELSWLLGCLGEAPYPFYQTPGVSESESTVDL